MSRSASVLGLALLGFAAWWGCAKGSGDHSTQSGSLGGGGSGVGGTSSTGASGTGGDAGMDGGDGGPDDAGPCVSTSVPAQHVPFDIVFLVEQTQSMSGPKWMTVSSALQAFFNDPVSAGGVGAGLVLFPYSAYDCDVAHYKNLTVPVGPLPANAAALASAIPADAVGVGLPMFPALQGALMEATALKDANPTHKVAVVMIADADPNGCDNSLDDVAALAASALSYNGVHTYVIALPYALLADLNPIAAAGGTSAALNATINIGQVGPSLAQIRTAGLGCDYTIPTPQNQTLDPDKVNFSYTPKGMGQPVVLLRVQDLAGCNGQPAWYYDDNSAPTKIVLCPASCATIQADTSATLDVLFGCKSLK